MLVWMLCKHCITLKICILISFICYAPYNAIVYHCYAPYNAIVYHCYAPYNAIVYHCFCLGFFGVYLHIIMVLTVSSNSITLEKKEPPTHIRHLKPKKNENISIKLIWKCITRDHNIWKPVLRSGSRIVVQDCQKSAPVTHKINPL